MRNVVLNLVGPVLMAILTATIWQMEKTFQEKTPEPVLTHQLPAHLNGISERNFFPPLAE